jgi:hypothetical protein
MSLTEYAGEPITAAGGTATRAGLIRFNFRILRRRKAIFGMQKTALLRGAAKPGNIDGRAR